MTEQRPIDWAAVERDFCAGEMTAREVLAAHGVSHFALYSRARRLGWQRGGRAGRHRQISAAGKAMARGNEAATPDETAGRRRAVPATQATVARLNRLVRRLSRELERRLAGEATDPAVLGTREGTAQMLNALTRAVASLAALERGAAKEQTMNILEEASDAPSADAAWAEVERRLARLAAEAGAGPIPGDAAG